MNTAEKVQDVIEIQDQLMVKEFGIEELTAANILLMEKQIREIPEKPENKKQYQSAYQFNVDAKKLLPRIEERRKELKAPVLEKGKAIDDTAKKAKDMVQPLIELSGARRQAWEDKKAEEKAEREAVEQARLIAIQAKFDMLNHLAAKPMEYNRAATAIEQDISHLEAFEISAIDFQERQGEAELVKSGAIANAKAALENRKKFEADQANAARVKAEQDAEAKRLENERAKLEAERKAQEKAAQAKADAEAEKIRQQEEKIRAEREALEKEKAEAAHAAIVAEREAVLDVAHQENFDRDHDAALIEHEQHKLDLQSEMDQARADAMARWEQTEAAKKANAERMTKIEPDKRLITYRINALDEYISGLNPLEVGYKTDEVAQIELDLIVSVKKAIEKACIAVETLK